MTAAANRRANLPRSSASDEELLLRFRDTGDQRAFEELVHRYEHELYNYLARFLRDPHRAEEVFQATFLRVYERRHLYQPDRRVRPWLYSIATHLAVDALRKMQRQPSVSLDAEHAGTDQEEPTTLMDLLESGTEGPSARMERREDREWARAAVDNLPDHLRGAILMVYFQGMKFREAAEALHVPVGTVKSRIHAALNKLHEAWQETQEAGG
jgi:RNA polymerase sigma-70 factor (ECF subfamily)